MAENLSWDKSRLRKDTSSTTPESSKAELPETTSAKPKEENQTESSMKDATSLLSSPSSESQKSDSAQEDAPNPSSRPPVKTTSIKKETTSTSSISKKEFFVTSQTNKVRNLFLIQGNLNMVLQSSNLGKEEFDVKKNVLLIFQAESVSTRKGSKSSSAQSVSSETLSKDKTSSSAKEVAARTASPVLKRQSSRGATAKKEDEESKTRYTKTSQAYANGSPISSFLFPVSRMRLR